MLELPLFKLCIARYYTGNDAAELQIHLAAIEELKSQLRGRDQDGGIICGHVCTFGSLARAAAAAPHARPLS